MTSVERSLEYVNLEQESCEGETVENWPSQGALRFEKIIVYYDGSKTPVLKGITFDIKPRETVGIVGRTGAGKSTVINALYRLYDFEGAVYIDGVDTKSLTLESLRYVRS